MVRMLSPRSVAVRADESSIAGGGKPMLTNRASLSRMMRLGSRSERIAEDRGRLLERDARLLDVLGLSVSGSSFREHLLQGAQYFGQCLTRQGAEPLDQPFTIHGAQLI